MTAPLPDIKLRELHTEASTDRDGTIHMTVAFCDMETGQDFTVTVSGPGHAKETLFVAAVTAFADKLGAASGIEVRVASISKPTKPS